MNVRYLSFFDSVASENESIQDNNISRYPLRVSLCYIVYSYRRVNMQKGFHILETIQDDRVQYQRIHPNQIKNQRNLQKRKWISHQQPHQKRIRVVIPVMTQTVMMYYLNCSITHRKVIPLLHPLMIIWCQVLFRMRLNQQQNNQLPPAIL